MFKIEYKTEALGHRWLVAEYRDPDDAYRIARRLIDDVPDILETTVVEQDGTVYAQWSREV